MKKYERLWMFYCDFIELSYSQVSSDLWGLHFLSKGVNAGQPPGSQERATGRLPPHPQKLEYPDPVAMSFPETVRKDSLMLLPIRSLIATFSATGDNLLGWAVVTRGPRLIKDVARRCRFPGCPMPCPTSDSDTHQECRWPPTAWHDPPEAPTAAVEVTGITAAASLPALCN